ncbi:MAG: T9SS type A sorting domain-containing protein, partial [Bacteroidetes bacterium]|nr:T9SS type A sorting domain-containing protein [Bacteroidota bacterium]
SDLNQAIYCDPVSGATNWEWEWVHAASGFSKTVLRNHSSTNFYPGWVGGIQYGKTYDVRVRAYSGGAWGSFGTVCQITTPVSVPGTKVRNADCGITLSDLNQAIYCDAVSGATNWEWEWVHAASGFAKTVQRNHSSNNFYPGWVGGIQYGKTYDVRVRAYSGGAWGSFGTVCQITTPASVPATKVRTADCGITLSSLSQAIYCDPVSVAYNYEWEWINAASGFSKTVLRNHSSNNFYPIWVPGIQYGKTYDVRVRAYSAGAWGSFGTVCQITTPAAKTAGTEDDNEQNGSGNSNNVFGLPDLTTPDNPVINIYPNPSDGKNIFITGFKPGDGIIKITLTDITGKNIFSDDVKAEEVMSVRPDGTHAQGIYFISITAGDKTHISKLIIDW